MRVKRFLVGVIALVMMMLLLTACEEGGTTVTEALLDSNNHIIVKFSDGSETDFGAVSVNVNEVKSIDVDEEKHAIVTYSDGSTKDLGYVGVVDESKNKIVSKTEVNADKHLIITYSDGTTEDKGFVGVEVVPELYIVKFLDLSGKLLSEQEVYAGRGAKAPAAPVVADKTFSNWDTDFTNVQGNLTIRPVYTSAAIYMVTFKDTDGTVLKTEQVISGHAATAPIPPKKENDIFVEWDNSFGKITSDLTVTAKYRVKKTSMVTFKDYTGVILGAAQVKEGETAIAPVTPTRDGYRFTGWSPALTNVTADKTVTAQYSLNAGTNIFDMSYTISDNKLVLTVAMRGTVKFCGMEGEITVPGGMTFVSASDGDGTVSNYKDGKIYLMFSSSNGKDVAKATTLTALTFTISDTSMTTATFDTTIVDIYDQSYADMAKTVIGETVKLK